MQEDFVGPASPTGYPARPEFGTANPAPTPDPALLARAKHLGYLKSPKPTGPTVEAYQSWCHRRGRPMVLLYDERAESSAIIYRFPPLTRALTPIAVQQILRRADDARLLGTSRPVVISRSGGRLTGLDRSAAEAVAFWIADAALDPDLTTPLSL